MGDTHKQSEDDRVGKWSKILESLETNGRKTQSADAMVEVQRLLGISKKEGKSEGEPNTEVNQQTEKRGSESNKHREINSLVDMLERKEGDRISSTLQTDQKLKTALFQDLEHQDRCTLKNLIWVEILEEAFRLLKSGRQVASSVEMRKKIHKVLLDGLSHFQQFRENEATEEVSKWTRFLQSLSWYIDPSFGKKPESKGLDTSIVNLLASKTREQRYNSDTDHLFEWVQCLHEVNKAPLFHSDCNSKIPTPTSSESPTPTPTSTTTQTSDSTNFHSLADGAGNTVLMLAAKASSVRIFEYIWNHSGTTCDVPLCKEKAQSSAFQSSLLSETNAFRENILHVMCKVPDLCVMHEILKTVDEKGRVETSKLVRSLDFFGKNILHQFFGRSLDSQKQDSETQNVPKEDELIIKLLCGWINNKVDAEKSGKDTQTSDPVLDMLAEEDSGGYNVLLTAVKNKNVASLDLFSKILENRNKKTENQHEMKKLLRNKNGVDIVHVCSAYADLTVLEVRAKKLDAGFRVYTDGDRKPKESANQSGDNKETSTYYGGPIRSIQKAQSGGTESFEASKPATESESKAYSEYMFGGPIRTTKMASDKQPGITQQSATGASEFEGWNAMHFACKHGNVKNIEFLLKQSYRTDELTAQWNTGGELAVESGYHKELLTAMKRSEISDHWLPKYVASVDPITSAFDQISRDEANRSLKARDPDIRAELQFVTYTIHRIDESTVQEKDKRMHHYFHCLNSGESVESYLYLCLQLDSAELYRCLINSVYWQQAVKTKSVEEIEDSTIRYIMGKRAFEDKIKQNLESVTQFEKHDSRTLTHLQATTVSAKLELLDYVKLTIPEDHEDEKDCCYSRCCMLPLCCKKCSCYARDGIKAHLPILKYMKNGVIFLSYLRKENSVLEQYSLIGLALLTGRVQMVKCLLMTRQYDLIPTALQVIIQTDKLISCDGSYKNPYLLDVKNFATHVVLNAINTLYTGSDKMESDVMFQYLLGQLSVKGGTAVPLKSKGQNDPHLYYTGECYSKPSKESKQRSNNTVTNDCDIRKTTVDFYARKPGYWPDDASRTCETSATGPYFQHHLKNGVEFRPNEDRRAMKCIILERNTLPMYSVVDLAKKSRVKVIFSTNCFQDLSENMWWQPVAAIASRSAIKEEQPIADQDQQPTPSAKKACCNWRAMFCPFGSYISHLVSYFFYLAIFMKYVLSSGYKFGWENVIVCLYIASFFVQELYEMFVQVNAIGSGITSYLKSIWNIYDWLLITFTAAGIVLVASIGFDLGRYELTTEAEKQAYLNSGNTLLTVFNSKMVLGFGFVFSAVKLLSALRYREETGGPLVVMYYVFLNDLLPFCLILAVMIGAFGTYFYAMLTVGGFEFYSNFTYQQDREKLTLVEVYTRPLLAVFGDFDLDNLRRCKEKRMSGGITKGCVFEFGANIYIYCGILLFIIIVNLIMINMLIAKFSSTVANKDKRSKIDWLFNKFDMLTDYTSASILPPPFNLLYYGPLGINYLRRTSASLEAEEQKRIAQVNQASSSEGQSTPKSTGSKASVSSVVKVESLPTFERFFVMQAHKFGGQRRHLYKKPIIVYGADDASEDAGPSDARIDFKKPGYQENEAPDYTTAAQEGPQARSAYRPNTPLRMGQRSQTGLV